MAAITNASFSPVHDCGGTLTNPTTGTVLADTGQLPAGLYEMRVAVGSSVAATYSVQHRNAANSGFVSDTTTIRGAAGQTGEYVFKYSIQVNERLRVLPQDNITGDAEATINAVRVV